MIKRTIDISEPAYLHLKNQQFCIDKQGELVAQIPIEDLGVVILQNPAIVMTQALMVACQKNNVAVVFCDERHIPYSVLLPLSEGNTLHSKILQQQINITLPTKKRLWQRIVQHKINAQAQTLKNINQSAVLLERLATQVKPGDPDNLEAQAAQAYWKLLFGQNFKRDSDLAGINSVLNYGYSIMRAMVARAIVSGGLHPTIGLNHHNQYNGLCLADDLMEPFRPWVDFEVYQMAENTADLQVHKDTKVVLLNLLSKNVLWERQEMPLMVASHYLVASLKRAFEDKTIALSYPKQLKLS